MEITSYKALIDNMEAVNTLVNKTIECSKDYTDSKKDDIIFQMVYYIQGILKDIMKLDAKERSLIVSYIMKYIKGTFDIESGNWRTIHGDTQIKVSFNRFDGDNLRIFMHEYDCVFDKSNISDKGLKYLIKYWDETKEGIDAGIKEGMYMINRGKQEALKKQLELHEAIKNFKI